MMLPTATFACNNSNFNLVSMQALGGNEYEFTVQFCAGHGKDATEWGAGGYTGTWAVWVDNNAAINTFPATLTSPATGSVFTGYSGTYGDSLLLYTRQITTWADTWACIDGTCGPVISACITFTFTTIGLPDNINLGGAEGDGVIVAPYGCTGNADMIIQLNAPAPNPIADAGPDQDVVYGWGSNCVDLIGSASSGVPPFTYLWSNGATTATANVCATSTTTYTLTVTDSNGNTDSDDVTVNVNDVNCGNNRVLICHRGYRTKCVKRHRVQRHLNHGDQLGACASNRLAYVDEPDIDHGLSIFPNPANDYTELKFVMDDDGQVNVEIYSIDGRLVQTITEGLEVKMDAVNYLDVYLDDFKSGFYTVVIESTSGERVVQKMSVVK